MCDSACNVAACFYDAQSSDGMGDCGGDSGGSGSGGSSSGSGVFVWSPPPPPSPLADASVTAQLLSSTGDLYFAVASGGNGYDSNASVSLNASSIALGEAQPPVLSLSIDGNGAIAGVTVPCQPSDIETLTPDGCALTTSYGKLGEVRLPLIPPPPPSLPQESFAAPLASLHALTSLPPPTFVSPCARLGLRALLLWAASSSTRRAG
jgi:hypothetical protein